MGYMKDKAGRRLDTFVVHPVRTPTVVLFGDSRTADCDYQPDALLRYSTNMSWFDWGQAYRAGGPVLDVIKNAGVGGNTTTQMLARMDADVIAAAPSYMTLWGGTNDPWSSTAEVDASAARMGQMMDKARAAGIYVFLVSETTSNTKGTTFPKYVAYYNSLLRGYAAAQPGVEFWDFNAAVTDPASTTGYHKAAMLRDGLHLSSYGASLIGRDVVAPRLARIGSELAQLPVSQIDTLNLGAPSGNAATNPLMLGTTGTLQTGSTGTVPQGWDSSRGSAVITSVQSAPARTDGIGNVLRSEVTATAGGTHFLTQTLAADRLVAGGVYVIEAAMKLEANTGLSQLSLTVQLSSPLGTHRYGWGYPVQSSVAGDALAVGSLVMRSRKFTAPAGLTGISLGRRLGFGGAGSANDELSRVAIRRVA